MKSKYLITGGLGFIGNELTRQLKPVAPVAILDNRTRIAPRIEDIQDIPVHGVDLVQQQDVSRVLHEVQPETVFHLAAIHYIPECNANPERTLRTNVEATMNLLRACSDSGVQHLIFASSGAVYADGDSRLSESAKIEPSDIYGWSKRHAEELCLWHSKTTGLPVTLCRLFNNFGPRETNAHIIPEIIHQLRQGNILRLGNVEARRDYIHTQDTARALIALAGIQNPKGTQRVVNIASENAASIRDLVDLIQGLLQRDLTIQFDPSRMRRSDKMVQVADTEYLRTLTGFQPRYNLETGLRQLLKFEGLLS